MVHALLSLTLALVYELAEDLMFKFIVHIPADKYFLDQMTLLQLFKNTDQGQPVHLRKQQLYLLNADLLRKHAHAVQHFIFRLRQACKPCFDHIVGLLGFFQGISLFLYQIHQLHQEKCISVSHLEYTPELLLIPVKLRQIFVEQLHGLLLRKGIQRNNMEIIFLHEFLQGFHNFHIIVLVISTHEKDPLCAQRQENPVQKLEAHGIHPLDIVKEQHYLVLFHDFAEHVQDGFFHKLICQPAQRLLIPQDASLKETVKLCLLLLCDGALQQSVLHTLLHLPEYVIPGAQEKFRLLPVAGSIQWNHLIAPHHLFCLVQKR